MMRYRYLLQHLGATLAFGGFSLRHTISDANKLAIDVFQAGSDGLSNGLLDLLLDEASSEGFHGLVKEIVFRVTNGEFECIDLDDDALNFED